MGLLIGELKQDDENGWTLTGGMSSEIYKKLDIYLSPPLKKAVDEAEDDEAREAAQKGWDKSRDGWRILAYSIASGIITHIKENMVIKGIETAGNVNTSVKGDTETAIPDNHYHEVDLPVKQENVVFTQSNDGTGLVE